MTERGVLEVSHCFGGAAEPAPKGDAGTNFTHKTDAIGNFKGEAHPSETPTA